MKYQKELVILRAKLPETAQFSLRMWSVLLYANLQAEETQGLTPAVKKERQKILTQLNRLSVEHLNIKWDNLTAAGGRPAAPGLYPKIRVLIKNMQPWRARFDKSYSALYRHGRKNSGFATTSPYQIGDWLRQSTARLQAQGITRADDLLREYPATIKALQSMATDAQPPKKHAKPPPVQPPAFDLSVGPLPVFDLTETAQPAQPAEPRYANLNFVDGLDRARVVAADHSLAAGKEYLLRANIGAKLAESIVTNATRYPFPAQNLPPSDEGWWLDVRVDSRQFVIPAGTARMFLPKNGASWVCGCPADQPHACQPADRQPFVYLPAVSPAETGSAQLDLLIYYHNNLVQSQLVTAAISQAEERGAGHHATIQFSLDARLQNLALPARDLNILTTRSSKGARRVIVNGAEADIALDLNDDQTRVTLEDARQALRDAHFEEWKSAGSNVINRRNKYDPETLGKSRDEFIQDLTRLANVGQALWGLLLQSYPPETWKDLQQPRTIQVCRINGSSFLFPWAMIYDIPLDPGGDPKLCPLLEKDAWAAFAKSLESSHPRACPHAAAHYQPGGGNTLCPFGFWGFKHFIEVPPSVPKGGTLKTVIIRGNSPPQIVVGRSTRLDANLTKKHLQALQDMNLSVTDCTGIDAVRDALKTQMELVYFYCHGKWDTKSPRRKPYLEVGQADAILPDHILYWRREDWGANHWAATAPLVMINGCHTLEITPESLLNFVDSFTTAQASGVIGTEITIEQNIASEVGRLFLGSFRAGSSVGEAMQAMRLSLLARNNLMGLNYIAYCSTDLALEKSPV